MANKKRRNIHGDNAVSLQNPNLVDTTAREAQQSITSLLNAFLHQDRPFCESNEIQALPSLPFGGYKSPMVSSILQFEKARLPIKG
jgi:hypothetical protein